MSLFNRRGYTIDQTILIVAIIAILITLVIITLGWTLLSRTSGSKLGAFTEQITQAVTTYYSNQHTFPATLSDLDGEGLIKFRKAGNAFYHDIGGSAGTMTLRQVALSVANTNSSTLNLGGGAGTYLVTEFTQVPAAEANEADKGIDGSVGAGGHFIVQDGTTDCTSGANVAAGAKKTATKTTTICFIGDKVN